MAVTSIGRGFVTGSASNSVRFPPGHLKSLRYIAASAWTLLAVAGCAQTIGLRDDYYVDPDTGLGGSTAPGGAGGAGAESATGGEAGATNAPLCGAHPITSRSAWVPTSSTSYAQDPVSNVVDNSPARWSTGKPQSGNEWLQIDFGATVSVRTINLQQGSNMDSNDYPRSYALYVSDDEQGMTGSPCATGVGTNGVSTGILLPRVFAGRYLMIRQLGTSLSWWSVDEIEVSCTDD